MAENAEGKTFEGEEVREEIQARIVFYKKMNPNIFSWEVRDILISVRNAKKNIIYK